MPAIGGSAAASASPPQSNTPPSGMDMSSVGQALAGAPTAAPGMDAQRQQLEGAMQAIRQLADQVKALGGMIPQAADEITQIQNLLKSVVVKAAQAAPAQTMSGAMVPGNGGGA